MVASPARAVEAVVSPAWKDWRESRSTGRLVQLAHRAPHHVVIEKRLLAALRPRLGDDDGRLPRASIAGPSRARAAGEGLCASSRL